MSTCTVASLASSAGWATVVLAGRGGLMKSRRISWYGSTCWRAVTNWFNQDQKSTRLNSSHGYISYAVFCLKKKKSQKHDWSTHAADQTSTRRITSGDHHSCG